HKFIKAINNAFFRAALHGKTSVVEFLLGTGHIGPETFDKGFEGAAGTTGGTQLETTLFLYYTHRASSQSLNKRLYENENISSDAIVTAFKRAVGGGGSIHAHKLGQPEIAILLFEDGCIPLETINEAFLSAAQNGHDDVVECMRKDRRISSKSIGEAFAAAAGCGNSALMESLYDTKRV
ncbi:hypothetical protein PHYSODRAFT_386332, partial [Phytophthora sojae]